MNNELNLYRMRLVVRGTLDCFDRDSGNINEALTAQGKVKLIITIETVKTALLWIRRMIEDALSNEEK